MSTTLQTVIVALIALGALAWLIASRMRARRRGGDGACENCPAAHPIAGVAPPPQARVKQVLYTIEPPKPAGKR